MTPSISRILNLIWTALAKLGRASDIIRSHDSGLPQLSYRIGSSCGTTS